MDKDKDIKIEEKKGKIEEVQRIAVSKEAQDAISEVMERVNSGFFGGKVNRMQIANWALIHLKEVLSEANIMQIRSEHFDEITLLESILRRAKENGKVPLEFKDLLQKQFGTPENAKNKSKRALTINGAGGPIEG